MKAGVVKLFLSLAGLLLTVPVFAQSYNPGTAVRINDVEISNQRFDAYYTEYRKGKGVVAGARGDQLELMKELRREAMDQLIDSQLLAQEANKIGINVTDEELDKEWAKIREPFNNDIEFQLRLESEAHTEESFRQHLRDMLAAKHYLDAIRLNVMEVSDEELQAFYDNNHGRLTMPAQVRVRHVLRSWRPTGAADERKSLYDEVEKLRQRALEGEDFAELAAAYSNDSTRVDGGDVGFFHHGQMVPAFERAAFALQPGEISDIVETPYGLHFIKLEERKEARLLPLDEVRDQLRVHIQKERMEKAEKDEIARLRDEADIEIFVRLGKKDEKKK